MSLTTVFLFSGTVFGWGAFSEMLQAAAWLTILLKIPSSTRLPFLLCGFLYYYSRKREPLLSGDYWGT